MYTSHRSNVESHRRRDLEQFIKNWQAGVSADQLLPSPASSGTHPTVRLKRKRSTSIYGGEDMSDVGGSGSKHPKRTVYDANWDPDEGDFSADNNNVDPVKSPQPDRSLVREQAIFLTKEPPILSPVAALPTTASFIDDDDDGSGYFAKEPAKPSIKQKRDRLELASPSFSFMGCPYENEEGDDVESTPTDIADLMLLFSKVTSSQDCIPQAVEKAFKSIYPRSYIANYMIDENFATKLNLHKVDDPDSFVFIEWAFIKQLVRTVQGMQVNMAEEAAWANHAMGLITQALEQRSTLRAIQVQRVTSVELKEELAPVSAEIDIAIGLSKISVTVKNMLQAFPSAIRTELPFATEYSSTISSRPNQS